MCETHFVDFLLLLYSQPKYALTEQVLWVKDQLQEKEWDIARAVIILIFRLLHRILAGGLEGDSVEEPVMAGDPV